MEYWVRLADIINREPIHERDRFMMAMLKPLGVFYLGMTVARLVSIYRA